MAFQPFGPNLRPNDTFIEHPGSRLDRRTQGREISVKTGLGSARGLWACLGVLFVVTLAMIPAATASSEASEAADVPVVEQLLDLLRSKGDISDEQYEEMEKTSMSCFFANN